MKNSEKKSNGESKVENMVDKSTDTTKLIKDATRAPSEKRVNKKRIFKVSTFHH